MINTIDSHVIQVGGASYIVGAAWFNIEAGGQGNWLVMAKKTSGSYDKQYGLALLRRGKKKKQPFQYALFKKNKRWKKISDIPSSLALATVNAIPVRNFLGFYPLASGYWIFAMSSGQILMDGDQYYEKYEDAKQAFEKLKDSPLDGGWNKIVFCETEEEALNSFSTEEYEEKYIDLYKQKKNYGALIKGFVLFSLIAAGVYFSGIADEYIKPPVPQPPRPENYFEQVWQKRPAFKDVYSACVAGMNKVDFFSQGWDFDSAVCDEKGNLTVLYRRGKLGSYKNLPAGAVLDKKSIDMANMTIKPGTALKNRGKQPLKPVQNMHVDFIEEDRLVGNQGTISFKTNGLKPIQKVWPEGAVIGETPGATTLKANYIVAPVVIKTEGSPDVYAAILESLPGFVLKKMEIKKHNGFIHTFSGDLYAK